jgi:hypothetical protein
MVIDLFGRVDMAAAPLKAGAGRVAMQQKIGSAAAATKGRAAHKLFQPSQQSAPFQALQ